MLQNCCLFWTFIWNLAFQTHLYSTDFIETNRPRSQTTTIFYFRFERLRAIHLCEFGTDYGTRVGLAISDYRWRRMSTRKWHGNCSLNGLENTAKVFDQNNIYLTIPVWMSKIDLAMHFVGEISNNVQRLISTSGKGRDDSKLEFSSITDHNTKNLKQVACSRKWSR